MSEDKSELIKNLLEMQRRFIDSVHAGDMDIHQYFDPDPAHGLASYIQDYTDLSNRLVDAAHEEKGSSR